MRITNRMMTTGSLNNIRRNKINMNTKANQYETGQKIQRPSEDPVVAVRSLKYRTQLTELTQYVEKNIPDAFSWMEITETAMVEVNDILEKMHTYCNQGATDTLEAYDRNSIIETLQQYKEHISDMMNSDFAGRYVFTGFRTDTPMLFDKAESNVTYTINESFQFADIRDTSYVYGGTRYDTTNPNKPAEDYAQEAPTMEQAHKIKLTYNKTDDALPTIVFKGVEDPANPGTDLAATPKIVSLAEPGGACYHAEADEIIYIKETGELILGEDYYKHAQNADSMDVTYEKTNFDKDDIRPEHYFECDAYNHTTQSSVHYTTPAVQKIEYEINFSQMLVVNTLGKDAFPTTIGSKIDELIQNVNAVFDMDTKIAEVEKMIGTETDAKRLEALNQLKEQLSTEQTLKKKVLQETFASGLTTTKDAQEKVSIAVSNHGSRYNRLELTASRLEIQQTDFKEMLDNNDLVEMEDAIIGYKSAETVYNASLSCAATIVKNTLLDFL